jgi:hypothetical protein
MGLVDFRDQFRSHFVGFPRRELWLSGTWYRSREGHRIGALLEQVGLTARVGLLRRHLMEEVTLLIRGSFWAIIQASAMI